MQQTVMRKGQGLPQNLHTIWPSMPIPNLITKYQSSMLKPIKWTHKHQHITGASQILIKYVIISHLYSLRVYWSENHGLQYSQFKFKLDHLMTLKILDSIPSEVTNLWTLTWSMGQHDSLFFFKKSKKESWFSSFEKFVPVRNSFFGVATYFLFLF